MSTIIGQLSHFDISTPNFDPIGSLRSMGNTSARIVLTYGESAGIKRKRLALRRYVYVYLNSSFVFLSTYKGVRNRNTLPSYVGDTDDLNIRSAIYSQPMPLEGEPYYINQSLLNSLFLYPNVLDYFFLDCSHSCRMGGSVGNPNYRVAPNFLEIYRYGKLSKEDITKVIALKNNLISTRSVI